MGGGSDGNFGNTTGKKKSVLDSISDLLTLASLAPAVDSFVDVAAIPVDALRGDWLSVGLDMLGVIPLVGEVGDSAKLAKLAGKISNPILKSKRVGKATKLDAHHAFSDIIDNYAGKAKRFSIKGADGKTRTLYQIKGSLNGKDGIFEWILDKEKGVTHRRFIKDGKVTGKPNSR